MTSTTAKLFELSAGNEELRDKAALFVQILEMAPDKALKALSPYGGVVLKTSIYEKKEQVLRDALQRATAVGLVHDLVASARHVAI